MKIKLLQLDTELPVPTHARAGDAGLDMYASSKGLIRSGERQLVPLGVKIELPPGKAAWLVPRSGHAKLGVTITNSPGLIDSGYRGELMCWVENRGPNLFAWSKGDRICQMVVTDYTTVEFEIVTELSTTDRGEGGFGSTGTAVAIEMQSDVRDLVSAVDEAVAAIDEISTTSKKSKKR
jgi:dUTP pyrophosphatase